MGGNLFKDFEIKRLDRKDYMLVFDDVKSKLSNLKLDVVPACKEKKDFGDLDIIVELETIEKMFPNIREMKINNNSKDPKMVNFLEKTFNSRGQHLSFPVISFEYRKSSDSTDGFQVDLITVPKKNYEFSLNYFSYNDLGNLIGVIYRHLGLKFGHDGVNKEIYHPELKTEKLGEINITKDFNKALSFIGLSPERFKQGFNNTTEVFEFISTSRYFNSDIYKLDSGFNDYKSRRRNAQRTTYRDFLLWIKEHENLVSNDISELKVNTLIDNFFKDKFSENISKMIRDFDKRMEIKKRFEGEIVHEWTGLTHQALGHLLKTFRGGFESEKKLLEYVDKISDAQLKNDIITIRKSIDFTGMIGDPDSNPAKLEVKRKFRS